MLFNSYVFIFAFLPICLLGFHLAARWGKRGASLWLIAASLVFYAWWNPVYLWLILFSVAVNFWIGWKLRSGGGRSLLVAGLTFNLGLLGYFKYAGFFAGIFASLSGADFRIDAILLPLAISFVTFQQITYLVDCHSGRVPDHDMVDYVLCVTFFPHLLAGPIIQPSEIMPQLRDLRPGLRRSAVAVGLTLFVFGLFKKVVLAEPLAELASPVFNGAANGERITLLEAWGAATAFTLQIYFDFSGYSDMALGLSRMFGIRLPVNFNSPLRSTSIIEFWQRWHMSLTRFLGSYLYNPMAIALMRRRALAGKPTGAKAMRQPGPFLVLLGLPTTLTMTLAGLWHGAGWTFVLFGLLHGVMLVINHGWRTWVVPLGPRHLWEHPLAKAAAWSATMLFLITTLVIFRAQSWDAATELLAALAGLDGRLVLTPGYAAVVSSVAELLGWTVTYAASPPAYYRGIEQIALIAALFAFVLVLPNTQQILRRYGPACTAVAAPTGLSSRVVWRPDLRWAMLLVAMLSWALTHSLSPAEFVYFQF